MIGIETPCHHPYWNKSLGRLFVARCRCERFLSCALAVRYPWRTFWRTNYITCQTRTGIALSSLYPLPESSTPRRVCPVWI